MNATFDYSVRNHNGQCSYGEWLGRDEIPANHAEWIDCAIIEGDVQDGDTITVEGGVMYRLRFAR